MDLKEAWKNLEHQKLTKPIDATVEIPRHSKHPVSQLIQKFKLGIGFCIFFLVIFISIAIFADQIIVKIGLAVVIFFYALLFAINLKVLKNLQRLYHSDEPVSVLLKSVYSIVTETIKFQQKFSWAFFPACVVGGFILGLSLKKDALQLITQPRIYLSMVAAMIVMTPACFFLARWMTKLTYGKYLAQIQSLINQTKEE
jgi:hypothetical protein